MHKPKLFLEVKTQTWEAARDLARRITWMAFRGQACAGWKLTPTLERALNDYPSMRRLGWLPELFIVQEFQRSARSYLTHFPREDAWLDWLSIIQHHGGPTRLLDFTRSFYVAAFIAFERATGDAAVWAVNLPKLQDRARIALGIHRSVPSIGLADPELTSAFDRALSRPEIDPVVVAPLEPSYMTTERLSIQQGLFLSATNPWASEPNASFETALAASFDPSAKGLPSPKAVEYVAGSPSEEMVREITEHSILKITVPREAHKAALEDLRRMNVSAATLFPGLDGFARSLLHFVRQFEERRSPEEFAHDLINQMTTENS